MKDERFLVTMKDVQRYRILMGCLEKRLTATQASQILGLSYIHTLRLKKIAQDGLRGLLRPRRPSGRKIPQEMINKVCCLSKDKYLLRLQII